jgi:hypothetical protein
MGWGKYGTDAFCSKDLPAAAVDAEIPASVIS